MILDPTVTSKLDYEVELGVVIGKPGRHIPKERALEHVFGYVVTNDITARDRQAVPHPEGGFEYRLGPGKNFDTSAPIGPWIVTRDEVPDPQSLNLRTLVNGELRQSNSTAKMIWDVATIVSFFSDFYTLQPGVLIETGTPGGTAWATDPEIGGKPFEREDVTRGGYMKPGDVVTVEIDGIGTLDEPDRGGRVGRGRQGGLEMAQALLEQAPMLFLNAKLVDGTGRKPVKNGAVRVEENRITTVGKTSDFGENPNGNHRVIDLKGKTLMPGLVEGHFHCSFWGVRELPDLDLKLPAERTTVYSMQEPRARASLRLHGRRERRGAAPDRRHAPRHGQRGRHPRPAHGRFRPRHLRDVGDARLEPVVLEARRWTAWRSSPTASRRCARRSARTSARAATSIKLYVTGEGLLRAEPAAGGDDVLLRGDRGRGRRGAQAQPPDRGARRAATTASSSVPARVST